MAQYPAVIELANIDGSNGFRILGAADEDYSGASVASAGDVNGDGFLDLIVGAPGCGCHAGSAYVVLGQAGGFAAVVDLTDVAADPTLGFRLDGAAIYDG